MAVRKIAVLGSGAFGSALSCVAARAGHAVALWGRSQEIINEINSEHTNRSYLGGLKLETAISATTDIEEAMDSASCVLLSIPTQTLSSNLGKIPLHSTDTIMISTCKGLDQKTDMLPHQLIREAFPDNPVASLSGPSIAGDVVSDLPTAVTIASHEEQVSVEIADTLSTDTFRCYASSDIIGVELGGALKNVLALAVGTARGMGLGVSAEAALTARGFAEITRLAVKLGAKHETLAGLSGLGDIVLSCSSPKSRNFAYGMAIGNGEDRTHMRLAEGSFTAAVALRLAQENKVDAPITEAIVNVLENRLTAHQAVHQLLTRPLRREN